MNTTIDELRKMTPEQLKAIAYDEMLRLQQAQGNLEILQSLINEKQSEVQNGTSEEQDNPDGN